MLTALDKKKSRINALIATILNFEDKKLAKDKFMYHVNQCIFVDLVLSLILTGDHQKLHPLFIEKNKRKEAVFRWSTSNIRKLPLVCLFNFK